MSQARIFGICLMIGLFVLGAGFYRLATRTEQYDFPLARDLQKEAKITVKEFVKVADQPAPPAVISSVPGKAPASKILIEVPFFVQAPTGNWGMPYQEACEEASLIMVHHFLKGAPVTPEQADKEILEMVAWEDGEFHYNEDLTVADLKRVAEDYYHHTGQLLYDFTIEDMKRLLAQGRPIIVPLAGRDLGNPYYSGAGPWYHMLVITGYDGNYFITNDVGTKRGHSYRYPQQTLFDAIHDWTGVKENIRDGRKAMLVLES